MTQYISVRNWRKFQHYDPSKRTPPWIKNYTELMSDDAYLSLTAHARGVLHGIWMEYATARCQLPLNTRTLSRRLNVRVTTTTLELLNHAGFLDFVASALLAEGYQDASAALASRAPVRSLEAEAEAEAEKELLPADRSETTDNGLPFDKELLKTELLQAIGADADQGGPGKPSTVTQVAALANRLPASSLAKVRESLATAHPKNRAAYAIGALQSEFAELASRRLP